MDSKSAWQIESLRIFVTFGDIRVRESVFPSTMPLFVETRIGWLDRMTKEGFFRETSRYGGPSYVRGGFGAERCSGLEIITFRGAYPNKLPQRRMGIAKTQR